VKGAAPAAASPAAGVGSLEGLCEPPPGQARGFSGAKFYKITYQTEIAVNEIRVAPAAPAAARLVLKGDLYDVEHAEPAEARVSAREAAEANEFAVVAAAPGVAVETVVAAGEIALEDTAAAASRQHIQGGHSLRGCPLFLLKNRTYFWSVGAYGILIIYCE